jgi:hypothetical protein
MKLLGLLLSLGMTIPAWAAAPQVSVRPEEVVLGGGGEVLVEVRLAEPGPRLRFTASGGELRPLGRCKKASCRLQWTPPDVRYPGEGVLLFWQEKAEGLPEVSSVRIPMLGRIELELETDPGAQVRVRVGARQYGPVAAGPSGEVKIPVEVGPGDTTADVLAASGDRQTARIVSLPQAPSDPLAAALTPEPVPDGGGWLIVAHGRGDQPPRVRGVHATVEETISMDGRSLYRVTPEPGEREVGVELLPADGGAARTLTAQVGRPKGEPPLRQRLSATAAVGGFFSGGANGGPLLELGVGLRTPWLKERVSLELAAGVRTSGFLAQVPVVGEVRSRVWAVPLELSAKVHALDLQRVRLEGRAGLGLVPFWHRLAGGEPVDATEGGLGFEGFVGAQASYPLARHELTAELRGGWSEARTDRLQARPAGAMLLVGGRYLP